MTFLFALATCTLGATNAPASPELESSLPISNAPYACHGPFTRIPEAFKMLNPAPSQKNVDPAFPLLEIMASVIYTMNVNGKTVALRSDAELVRDVVLSWKDPGSSVASSVRLGPLIRFFLSPLVRVGSYLFEGADVSLSDPDTGKRILKPKTTYHVSITEIDGDMLPPCVPIFNDVDLGSFTTR